MNALAKLNLRPSPNYPIKMLVLSHSSREMFRSCARKLEFRQFFGSSSTREENYAGSTGTAIHRALGKWFETGGDVDEAIIEFLKAFPIDLEMLKPYHDKRSLEACFATLSSIIETSLLHSYDVAQIKLHDGTLRHALEVPFAIEIVGAPLPIPVWFVGFMDCVLFNTLLDRYIVVDLKTTRSHMDDYFPRFQFDEQVIPYAIVLEHALGRKIEEFDVSYLNAYIDLIEPKPALYEVKKTQEDIHDWLRGLCDDISRIGKYYKDGWFPRATDGKTCMSWNTRCQFFDYCYYREPTTLSRMIDGEVRTELFSKPGEDGKPIQPWITAQLEFVK